MTAYLLPHLLFQHVFMMFLVFFISFMANSYRISRKLIFLSLTMVIAVSLALVYRHPRLIHINIESLASLGWCPKSVSSMGFAKSQIMLKVLANISLSTDTAYEWGANSSTAKILSQSTANLTEFISEVRTSCLSRKLKLKLTPIVAVFRDPPFADVVRPFCDGLWLEFGVFRANTLNHIAYHKKRFCGPNSTPVYGFDTFAGLPTAWRPGFAAGTFNTYGTNITVLPNVRLVRGLFIDTLPGFLRMIDAINGYHSPVSVVHVDCDIYDGARDVLFLLQSRLVPGTIIIFDELFNYPGYEQHEIKALFELMSGVRLRLLPLGSSTDIELKVTREGVNCQSFGFVVETVG